MLRKPLAPSRSRSPLLVGLGTLVLLAAACGSGPDAATDALSSAGSATPTTAAVESTAVGAQVATTAAGQARLTLPAPASSDDEAQSGAAGQQATASSAAAGADTSPTTAAPTTTPTVPPTTAVPTTVAPTTAAAPAPAVNSFPAVAVKRIADQASVNASDQLGGGSRPVLLWFWSPF